MTDAVWAYYPVFRRRAPLEAAWGAELASLFEKFADRVRLRAVYSTVGLRPDADLMLWCLAHEPDALQELLVAVRRTQAGRALELTHAFLGVTRPAEFTADHLPGFLKGVEPKRYLSVYPFVRTAEWYLLPPTQRARLLRQHGEMGREFPEVSPNTTAAFGLGDWEWILAFESDDLTKIVDCIRRLREAEARRFTKLDVPFVLGIRTDLAEALANLA